MKSTGYLVSSTAKFTACMKNCKYYFNCRKTCLVIDSYRDTTSIIRNCNGVIFINHNLNGITETCKCLINRIINNFIYKMMKTSAGGSTNIHTGSFSDCLKPFQYLNLVCAVIVTHTDNRILSFQRCRL